MQMPRRDAMSFTGSLIALTLAASVGSPQASGRSVLAPGAGLEPGASLLSNSGQFRLVMQATDGNLVLYGPNGALWYTGPAGAGARAVMQTDGNFVLYRLDGSAAWSSGTSGVRGVALYLQDDSNLVMYSGPPVWARGQGSLFHLLHPEWVLSSGTSRYSLDRRFELVMQGDGNLVLYQVGVGALWASYTFGQGNRAVMQGDGNFVIYNSAGSPLWNSGTAGRSGSRLVTQDDGNVVIYHGSEALWSTRTSARSTASGLAGRVDSFVSQHLGRYVDYDRAWGAQCVDLFNFYNRDVVGAANVWVDYASQLFDAAPAGKYEKFGSSTTPVKGDVAIYSSAMPGSGGAGHVAIVLGQVSASTLQVFDQNYPTGSPCSTHQIAKSYLRGYLRPKV